MSAAKGRDWERAKVVGPARGIALALAVATCVLSGGKTYAAEGGVRFEEIGARAGLRWVHSTRDFGQRHKAEVLEMFTDGGAASAVGDFDGDGDDDLFVVDSDEGKSNHLMRNDGNWKFVDIGAT